MTYSERLRGLREDRDLTQTQLAEILHTSQKAISNWENGRNEPPYDILIKYAKFFGVSADYLLGITDKS
ncbi:MAG: helix-turn-helix domain-containing protein [Candidatus Fimenecus sp.]